MMKHLLSSLVLCIMCMSTAVYSQVVYEDFEGGASKVAWAPLNGLAYEGPVANPAKDAVNSSDNVGKFSNDGIGDFCFGLGTLTTSADLSVFNLMKIKIWSPVAPTTALLKFEGPNGNVEKFINITVANAWVDYSVDLSGGAAIPNLGKILLAFHPFTTPVANTYYFDDIRGVEAKEVFNTFETASELVWQGFDGTYEAPVANPAPNSINSSANCAKYTKSGAHAYSLLLADKGTPFDLSILNQFKIQIHASAPTQVLVKLEGAGGPPVEKFVNIGLANVWQEYTIDLSSAKDAKYLTKAILFFDAGVETSADVYHYDNFYAVSQGACAGVVKNNDIIDDFECQRNGTITNGWDVTTVVTNPAPDGINGSRTVGRYEDPLMAPWDNFLIDYQDPIDLSVKNQFSIKVWSPRVSKFLVKLEGGTSAPNEVWVDITEANKWVDYTVDFGSQSLASHKKLVIFFTGGEDALPGDIYFIDDLKWGEKVAKDLENFETGVAALPWEPLDQQALLHGAFAVVDNPDKTALNASNKVGKYTKGTSPFSTVAAVAPGFIDISVKPQYNLDVWTPAGTKTVTMQLESASAGNKSVERDVATAGQWEKLSFNFEDFNTVTDWSAMKLIFNAGEAEEGKVYYFDNLSQSESTVDPCEGSIAIANVVDDFECQRNYDYGAGADLLSVVSNPQVTPANGSLKVGLYKEQKDDQWSALCANFPDGVKLDVFNQLELQVLSTRVVPVLLKLEGGTSPAFEKFTSIKTANEWYTISEDMSSQAGQDHKRVCIFFNGGDVTPAAEDYFVDNIKLSHAPYNGCLMNFDDAAFTSLSWKYFPADNSGGFELVDNPLKAGINITEKVGKAIEKASGEQVWQGMFTDLESYIDFGSTTKLKMKVLSPQVGAITMKVETPLVAGFPGGSGDNTVTNTKVGEWEELTWDFSTSPTPIDPAGRYKRITLIWDINNVPAQDVIYYFDDLRIENTSCGGPSSSDDIAIDRMTIYPNPVVDVLKIENAQNISSTKIINIYGQMIAIVPNNNASTQYLDVNQLNNGTYIIMGYNDKNQLISQARFVKI